jgi:hypothetical protein
MEGGRYWETKGWYFASTTGKLWDKFRKKNNTLEEPHKSMGMHTSQLLFPGFGDTWCAAETLELPNASPQQVLSNVGTQSPSLGMKPSLQLDITQDKQFKGMENANTDQQQRKSVVQQHQQDDVLEHQKKEEMREARKKRKMLIEEQKQQKKTKKEDERSGPHGNPTTSMLSFQLLTMQDVSLVDNDDTVETGFRRPGSNTWVRGWEMPTPSLADMDRSKSAQDDHDEANQAPDISFNFQRERDRNMKESETDTDKEESSESQQEESNDSDNSFLQGLKAREIGKSFSNAKQLGYSPNENYKYPSEAQQCMSKGTDALQKTENTEEQDCKKQSLVGVGKPVPQSNTVGNNSNTVLSSVPITNSVTMTSTALHYPLPSFSVLPAPYSLPIPVPNNQNVPFPVGFSFPYLMHYIPPSVDCLDRTGARPPIYPGGFQLPPGYAPFQLPTPEASPSWVPVLRPQQSPTFYPANFGGARTSSDCVEDETKVSQG